jgi:hypothetical protein
MKRLSLMQRAENATLRSKFPLMTHNTIGKTDGVFVSRLR